MKSTIRNPDTSHFIRGGSMNKKEFFNMKTSFLQGVVFTVVIAGYFLVPAVNAAIDETMPSNIPSEIKADWQDQGGTAESIKASLPEEYQAKCDGSFESACHWRRVYRLSQFPCLEKILYARHHVLGGLAVGFWVNVGPSDVSDQLFAAKGAIGVLEFDNYYPQPKEILTKSNMLIKDPCVSLDGKKVVFAMSSGKNQGSLLYEMEIDNPGSVKQLTDHPAGLKVADFEPCYLPNGDIMFSSTRCFGVIDCGWQPTSNMFIMDSTGQYIRRVGYDQVHTDYPVLCPDGKILYTRWEYNDRDVSNVMGLFSMNPDGCRQTEVFGNQTTWPMTFIHGRPVPKHPELYFAVASGHHGTYSGEVFICDVSEDTNGPEYITMIDPPRKTETRDKNDKLAMGGANRCSAYPYPLSANWYLVSHREAEQESFMNISKTPFKIYLRHVDGEQRELLAWGNESMMNPMPLAPYEDIFGEKPFKIAQQADFNKTEGTLMMNDVYYGRGMEGIEKSSGEARTIRAIALKYRVTGACDNMAFGSVSGPRPSNVVFSAPTICPVSIGGASWEVKEVLGEAKIWEDGSASFKVPARKPIFLQVLDENGCCIANMRSWLTLMPGETFACYGCHENKSVAPPTAPTFLASEGEPQKLDTPLGIEGQGFDFKKMVQPILDDHCASCHTSGHSSGFDLTGGDSKDNAAKKTWTKSYASLLKGLKSTGSNGNIQLSNKAVCITSIFSQPPQMPPKSYGSTQSGIVKALLSGSMPKNGEKLPADKIKIIATWIDCECPFAPSYDSYMSAGSDAQKYHGLETTAQKWYDMEEKNVIEYAKVQDIVAAMPDRYNDVRPYDIAVEQPAIGFLPQKRALVLRHAIEGNFILLDLRGRVVSRMQVSQKLDGDVTVSLPSSLGRGLYMAKFEGVDGSIQKAKISVTQ
jgi:hypothetical protein